jgi:hypothetical protein
MAVKTKPELEIELKKIEEIQEELTQTIFDKEKENILLEEKNKELSEQLKEGIKKSMSLLPTNAQANLFRKITIVMENVKRVPKSGWNDFHKYHYANESDIVDGIRPILAEAGLALWTTVVSQEREIREIFNRYKPNDAPRKGWFTKVCMKFIIGDADTGESLESIYWGEGEDESDKGLYKAYTGAQKYFLTKSFLISSGDTVDNEPTDPEADTSRKNAEKAERERKASNTQNKQQNTANGQQGTNKPPTNQNQQSKPNETTQKPQNTDEDAKGKLEVEKAQMFAKWKLLGGDNVTFEAFYAKQIGRGANHAGIHAFLDQQIIEKKPEALKAQEEEKKDEEFVGKTAEEMADIFDLSEEEKAELLKTGKVDFPNK